MDSIALSFGFSSCPNDTFAFHALVHGRVPGPAINPFIADIEALNDRAAAGAEEVTKISAAAFGRLRDNYVLLRAGGVAGFGVGPIVVSRAARAVGGRVAIPGEQTTASLLLLLLGRFETLPMRFDQIEDAVLRGEVDCGVLIHEGRFTYEAKGLTQLVDLGAVWEARMKCPLPLAAIAIRRDLAPRWAAEFSEALRASVTYAFAQPEASRTYVLSHAREMDPVVAARHIRLYVNEHSLALDEDAICRLLAWGEAQGVLPNSSGALPMFG